MMHHTLLLLALFAGPVLADDEKLEVVPVPALPGEVPAGSREDQILWRDARDAIVRATKPCGRRTWHSTISGTRSSTSTSSRRVRRRPTRSGSGRSLAPRGPGEGPRRRHAARPARPVPLRPLYFEQSMDGEPGTELAARLPAKRAEAQKCRDEHRKVIATLGPAVKDVRAALDEVAPEIRQRMAARRRRWPPRRKGPRSRRRRSDPAVGSHTSSPPEAHAPLGSRVHPRRRDRGDPLALGRQSRSSQRGPHRTGHRAIRGGPGRPRHRPHPRGPRHAGARPAGPKEWNQVPVAVRVSELGPALARSVHDGLQSARAALEPCFEADERDAAARPRTPDQEDAWGAAIVSSSWRGVPASSSS